MIICNKCKVEKELNQFQTYWHSTQQKHRTRKECTECMYKIRNEKRRLKRKETKLIEVSIPTEIIQPVVPELEIELSIDDSNYKKCNTCFEIKPIEKFYFQNKKLGKRFGRCSECELEKDRQERLELVKEQNGAIRIKSKPNEYYDEYQKEYTFNILKAIGWIFNEEKGMWWKPGVKNEDGTFVNVKPNRYKYNKPLTDDQHRDMIMLRKKGMRVGEIAGYIGASDASVSRWLKLYEQKGEKYRD